MKRHCDNGRLATGRSELHTYFEVLLPRVHLRCWFWLGLSAIAVASCLSGYFYTGTPALLGTFTVLAVGIGLVPAAMSGIYSILGSWGYSANAFLVPPESDPVAATAYVDDQFREFAGSRVPWMFGLLFCGLASYAFWAGGAFVALTSPTLTALAAVVLVASSFVCGIGIAGIFYLGRLMWMLGSKYRVTISNHPFGVLSTGRALLKCYSLTAVVWAAYATSSTWSIRELWIPQLMLAAPAFAFFVVSFVVCQFPLHNRMVECKEERLSELEALLSELEPHQAGDLSDTRLRQCEFCVTEISRVVRWPEWPFSLGSLSGVFGAAFGAVAPQVLPVLLPWLFS